MWDVPPQVGDVPPKVERLDLDKAVSLFGSRSGSGKDGGICSKSGSEKSGAKLLVASLDLEKNGAKSLVASLGLERGSPKIW